MNDSALIHPALVSFDSEIRTALDIELLRISESGHQPSALANRAERCKHLPPPADVLSHHPEGDAREELPEPAESPPPSEHRSRSYSLQSRYAARYTFLVNKSLPNCIKSAVLSLRIQRIVNAFG
jgi:hypothetical protein